MKKYFTIPQDYALVLQQVAESGEEDFQSLSETLRFGPRRLAHILEELRHKGLLTCRPTPYGAWVRLSAKGRKIIRTIWPQAVLTM